jgi:DHA1 family inner membrane transport protein
MNEPRHAGWRNVIVLSGSILFTLTGLFSWTRLTSIYLRNLGASEIEVGWAMLILSCSHRLPQIFGGYLADRYGRKRIVGIATTLMAFCYAAIAIAPSWPLVVAANVLCWIIGAIQWPALLLLVAESVPEEKRGRALAILETASMTGVTLGFLLGSEVLLRVELMKGAWTFLCLLTCGCYVAAAIARIFGLIETGGARNTQSFLGQLGGISWRLIAVPTAAMVLSAVAFNVVLEGPLREIYLKDVSKFSDSKIDLFHFYGGLVSLPLAFSAGWLADRFGSVRVIVLSCLLVIAMSVPLLLPAGPMLAPWLFIALMAPQMLFEVSWQKLITTIAPAQNRALYVSATGMLAGLVVPWSNPLMMRLYLQSPALPYTLAIGASAIAAIAALLIRAQKRQEPAPLPEPAPE